MFKHIDIQREILSIEKSVMDCLLEWNEEEARKYSDKSHVLFMNNPDLCKPTSQLFAFHLLNRFAVFWNNSEFDKCKEILAQLDKMPLTGSELILKLCNAAELEFMLANYPKALSLIEKAMQLSPTVDEKYKLLLLKGKVEHEISGIPFEVNSFSEALGIAESLGNQEFIAEIYCELYTMFYSRYPGLAVYFARKAEVLYTNLKDIHNLKTTQLKIALTLQSIYDRKGATKESFKRNADSIVKSIEGHIFPMPSHEAFYNRIKGFVLKDEASIEKAFEYYNNVSQNECEIIRTLQMMLDVFIYTKNYEKVKKYMPLCRKLFPSQLFDELDDIEYRLSHNIPANRFQEFDDRKPGEPFTLLDVLNQIAIHEEWCFENQSHLLSDYRREGKFETKMMADGKISLIPCGLSSNNYYRGEREYHAMCKPSLYRNNMTEAKQFVERVKYEELCILMENYPLTQYYRNGIGFKFPDGTIKGKELSLDKMALAQHYGICTELIDFTTDKFVAAFFACTKYNADDTYSVNEEEGSEGCFYHYVDKNVLSAMPQKLRVVGLQPFSRPGEQSGYVMSMSADENLNDWVTYAIHFKHNRKVSEFIFNYTNRSKKLFPKSILEEKAMIIKNSNVFSRKAYEMAKKEFYSELSDEVLMGYLSEENKSLSETPIVAFSSNEVEEFHKEWAECGQIKLLNKIIVSEETIDKVKTDTRL